MPSVIRTMCLYVIVAAVRSALSDQVTVKGSDSKLLQEAFRDLMKIPQGRGTHRVPKAPPKYMLDLYEKYRTGKLGGVDQGSTIRSILAMKGQIRGDKMLVFNLSSVDADEQISKGELHFFRKKRFWLSRNKRPKKNLKLRMTLYDINEEKLLKLQTVDLAPKASGWQFYDVTKSAIDCRRANGSHNLLGLKFEVVKRSKKFKSVSPKRLIRHRLTPFLIVFSENADDNERPLDRLKRFAPENEVEKFGEISRSLKSSVYDNELPDPVTMKERMLPNTHPIMLEPRKKAPKIDANMIPFPVKERKKKLWNRISHRRRKSKKSSARALPVEWQGPRTARNDVPETGQCQKKDLEINFEDIGWGKWIISPKSFQANYCSGSCPFPLKKALRPSNHATIQSIVHAIGAKTDVPAPSCVPDAMSSMTLLYFDEDLNVVLRNYPGMVVERCACN